MNIFSIIVLIGFIGACFLAAMTGAAFRPGDWYEPTWIQWTISLPKPRL